MSSLDQRRVLLDPEQDLLAPNASKWMRALEQATRLTPEAWAAAKRVGDIKIDVPDDAIPFLVWEYGLEEVVAWVEDPRRAIREGRPWQRVRGTNEAARIALSWIDFDPLKIEENPADSWWDLYQMGFAEPVTDARRLAAIFALARLSKPSHTDIIRVWSPCYDLRALKENGGRINGDALVNDWSGIWIEGQPNWPKLSFCRIGGGLFPQPAHELRFTASRLRAFAGRLSRDIGFEINKDRINGPDVLNPRFALGAGRSRWRGGVGEFQWRRVWGYGGWTDKPYERGELTFRGIRSHGRARSTATDFWRGRAASDPISSFRVNQHRVGGSAIVGRRFWRGVDSRAVAGRRVTEHARRHDLRDRPRQVLGDFKVNRDRNNGRDVVSVVEGAPDLTRGSSIAAIHAAQVNFSRLTNSRWRAEPWLDAQYGRALSFRGRSGHLRDMERA